MDELINDYSIHAAKKGGGGKPGKDSPSKGKGGGNRKGAPKTPRDRNKGKAKGKDGSSTQPRDSEAIRKITYELEKIVSQAIDGDEPDGTDDGTSTDYIEPENRGKGLDFNVLGMTVGSTFTAFKGSRADRVKVGYAVLNRLNEEQVTANDVIREKQQEVNDTLNDLMAHLQGGSRILTDSSLDEIRIGSSILSASHDGVLTVTDSSEEGTVGTDDHDDDKAVANVQELLSEYGYSDEGSIARLKDLTSEIYSLKVNTPVESDLATILRLILPAVAYDSTRITRPSGLTDQAINVITEDGKLDENESFQIAVPLYDTQMNSMTGVGKLLHNIGAAATYIEEQLARGVNIDVMDANELVQEAIIRGDRLIEGKSTLFDEIKVINEILKRGYDPLALYEMFKMQFSDTAKRIFSKRTETGNPLSENLVFEILKEFFIYDVYKLRSLTLMDQTTSLTNYRDTDEILELLSKVEMINDKQKSRLDKIVADKTPKE